MKEAGVADGSLPFGQLPLLEDDGVKVVQSGAIMRHLARKLKLGADKVVVTVDQHGNTSAASIPLALDTAVRDGRIQRGQTLMLEGVGGGFTWGSVLLRY